MKENIRERKGTWELEEENGERGGRRVWERLSETHSVIGGHSHWLPIFSVVGLCEVSTQQVPERRTEIARVRESEREQERGRDRKSVV